MVHVRFVVGVGVGNSNIISIVFALIWCCLSGCVTMYCYVVCIVCMFGVVHNACVICVCFRSYVSIRC